MLREKFWDKFFDGDAPFWSKHQPLSGGDGGQGVRYAIGLPHGGGFGDTDSFHFLSTENADISRPATLASPLTRQTTLFTPPPTPDMSAEISYLNGINSHGTIVNRSFHTWNGNDPATYSVGSDTSKWGAPTAGTTGGTVNYYFDSASHWKSAEKDQITASLALWSAVANIHFNLVTSAASAQISFVRGHDGSAYESDSLSGTAGAGNRGGTNLWSKAAATISIDTTTPGFGPLTGSFTAFGGYTWETVIHEIGHALGLGHAGAYNGDVDTMTQQYSIYDTRAWSVMSYINPDETAEYSSQYTVPTDWGTSADGYYNNPTTMMMLDIIAIQQLYGAPTDSPLSSGRVYGFNTNINGPLKNFYDFTVNTTPIVTIWNAGTGNTLDLSGYSSDATVDLNPGSFSSCDGMTNNLCIAQNTVINTYIGSSGADSVTGNTGADIISTGDGNDTIFMGTRLTAADKIDGGTGNDTIDLDGNVGVTFAASTAVNIEAITLEAGFTYRLTLSNATVTTGNSLLIDGSALGAADTMTISAAAEKDGTYTILGGAANDVLTGGDGNDTINGGAGNDTLRGNRGADVLDVSQGNDTLIYTIRLQSTSTNFDTIKGFDFSAGDYFDMDVAVTGIDATVASGALTTASFDANLAAAVNAAHLAAHHAVLFTPTTGDYVGDTFLIVDSNGHAGYQASGDYVIQLDNPQHTASLDVSDFS